jgi:hypothetical protein
VCLTRASCQYRVCKHDMHVPHTYNLTRRAALLTVHAYLTKLLCTHGWGTEQLVNLLALTCSVTDKASRVTLFAQHWALVHALLLGCCYFLY